MTFRLILFSLLTVWGISLYAQTDSLKIQLHSLESMEIESVLDSIEQHDSTLEMFPAEALYKNIWSCSNIKYPPEEFVKKNDTIVFTLVGPNDHPYVHPYKGNVISKFGPRHGRIHTGTDVKLHLGDTVLCAFDGKVRLAQKFSGYGNLVLVRHKNGLETIYAHLKKISVKVNDTIKAGDLIGLGGRTGRATTEHLHFETRIFGDPFDSNKYIDFENFTLRSNKIYYKNKKIFIDIDTIKNTLPEPQPSLASVGDSIQTKPDSEKETNYSNTSSQNFIQYVIASGDNLWAIAKRYNTTVKNICEINKITVHQILRVGTILFIQ